MPTPSLRVLLGELERAHAYTDALQQDLSPDQIVWRPSAESSGIGWHLGHQAAVAHFMLRNLTAAEPRIDPQLEALMDSATAEVDRGELPSLARIRNYRSVVAQRINYRIGQIDEGAVGAPAQLRIIATTLLIAIINHEYQHSQWIGEVRSNAFGLEPPPRPTSRWLETIDDYLVLTADAGGGSTAAGAAT